MKQRLTEAIRKIGPRDDWRYGAGVIILGWAAFVLAWLYPYPYVFFDTHWQTRLQLLLFSGLVVIMGSYALPAANRRWYALKLLIAAAAVHWMFLIPLERYWYQF